MEDALAKFCRLNRERIWSARVSDVGPCYDRVDFRYYDRHTTDREKTRALYRQSPKRDQ